MPEWVSYVFIGLIIAEIFKLEKKGLVILGLLLPDFIAKIYVISLFYPLIPGDIIFLAGLYHSPVMGLIIPALILPLFNYNWKKTYFYLMLPFMLHLFLDSFTKGYSDDGILLYPFSHKFFSFGIFWPEQYWIIMVGSIIVYVLIKLYKSDIFAINH